MQHWGWRGVPPPPFEPPEVRAPAEFAGRGLAPLPPSRRGPMAERRIVTAAASVSPTELADWRAKAAAAGGAGARGRPPSAALPASRSPWSTLAIRGWGV